MDIYIIIITFNSSRDIIKCLESINHQTYSNYYLHIIDNNSTDGTVRVINSFLEANLSLKKKTHIQPLDKNLGFSKSVNIGLNSIEKIKDISFVLLLNPDTYFKSDLFKNAVGVLNNDKKVGACSPIILSPNNKIWWFGSRLFNQKQILQNLKYGISEHIDKGQNYIEKKTIIKEVETIPGCALFITLSAVKKVGLLNEKYYMYAEDIDYCRRLKSNGFKLKAFTSSELVHSVNDQKKDVQTVLKSLRKYKIYLTSVGKYIIEYEGPIVFIVWLIKLPFVLVLQFMKLNK